LSKKIAFLDRDGVINKFPGNGEYVTKVKDFHFIPGSLEAIKRLSNEGFEIFVISNQAGVGKGVYSKDKLQQINNKLLRGVKEVGAKVRRVFYCTHRSDAGCDCRKPGIGSIEKAMKILKLPFKDVKHSFFVGDTEGDIQAGNTAGCSTIFVLSGREDHVYMRRWDDVRPDFICKNLLEASHIILNGHPKTTLHDKKKKKRKGIEVGVERRIEE